ncbi:MAG: transketolase C-terminal domain-containing protein [Opitutaceae bacterium]|jgi:transketolase
MLTINPANARQWSRFGSRAVFGQAILDLAGGRPDLVVLSADLGSSSGLDRFRNAFPEQFYNVGIAEQNLIGVASGFAKEGFTVFATSFSPFISMRACEQVRMNLGYMNLNVKAVGIGSGLSMGFLGNSHYGLEDAAVMRSIAGMTVVTPADCSEIVKTVFAAADHVGPMYIRLTGGPNNPIVYSEDYEFRIGKAITLRKGADVTFIASGTMVFECLEAAKVLESQGLSAGVVNMHTLKPLDTDVLKGALETSKLLVTVEEHSVVGGLGSAVAEYRSGFGKAAPQLILGIPDAFGKTGEYRYLLEKYGLVGEGIVNRVNDRLKQLA